MADFQLTGELVISGAKVNPSVRNQIQRDLGAITGSNNSFAGVNRQLTQIQSNLDSVASRLNKTKIATTGAGEALKKTARETKGAADAFTDFGDKAGLALRRFTAFTIAAGGVFGSLRGITTAFREAVAFERELVKVAQVSDRSLKSLSGLTKEITRLSTTFGTSSNELVQVSRTLTQAGLSADEARVALEALAKSTLAPTFRNIGNTTEGAIASLRQFGLQAQDLEATLGSINAVSGRFAVEADNIVGAIQRAGGAFTSASQGIGSSRRQFAKFIALFTSVRATTRESSEAIATGLRTIISRLQRPTNIRFLQQLGIDLTDAQGQFVGAFEAVQRLGRALEGVNPRSRLFAEITDQIAGLRQVSRFIPLVQQYRLQQEALNVALEGQSSLTKDAAQAQGTLAIQFAQVRQEFTAFVRDLSNDQNIRTLISLSLDLARSIVQVADSIKGALPLIGGLFAARAFPGAIRGIRAFGSRVVGRNQGGPIPGTGNSDTVPALLTPGEFVIKKSAAARIGLPALRELNRFASGGPVGGNQRIPRFVRGDLVGRAGDPANLTRFFFNENNLGGNIAARTFVSTLEQAGFTTKEAFNELKTLATESKDASEALSRLNTRLAQVNRLERERVIDQTRASNAAFNFRPRPPVSETVVSPIGNRQIASVRSTGFSNVAFASSIDVGNFNTEQDSQVILARRRLEQQRQINSRSGFTRFSQRADDLSNRSRPVVRLTPFPNNQSLLNNSEFRQGAAVFAREARDAGVSLKRIRSIINDVGSSAGNLSTAFDRFAQFQFGNQRLREFNRNTTNLSGGGTSSGRLNIPSSLAIPTVSPFVAFSQRASGLATRARTRGAVAGVLRTPTVNDAVDQGLGISAQSARVRARILESQRIRAIRVANNASGAVAGDVFDESFSPVTSGVSADNPVAREQLRRRRIRSRRGNRFRTRLRLLASGGGGGRRTRIRRFIRNFGAQGAGAGIALLASQFEPTSSAGVGLQSGAIAGGTAAALGLGGPASLVIGGLVALDSALKDATRKLETDALAKLTDSTAALASIFEELGADAQNSTRFRSAAARQNRDLGLLAQAQAARSSNTAGASSFIASGSLSLGQVILSGSSLVQGRDVFFDSTANSRIINERGFLGSLSRGAGDFFNRATFGVFGVGDSIAREDVAIENRVRRRNAEQFAEVNAATSAAAEQNIRQIFARDSGASISRDLQLQLGRGLLENFSGPQDNIVAINAGDAAIDKIRKEFQERERVAAGLEDFNSRLNSVGEGLQNFNGVIARSNAILAGTRSVQQNLSGRQANFAAAAQGNFSTVASNLNVFENLEGFSAGSRDRAISNLSRFGVPQRNIDLVRTSGRAFSNFRNVLARAGSSPTGVTDLREVALGELEDGGSLSALPRDILGEISGIISDLDNDELKELANAGIGDIITKSSESIRKVVDNFSQIQQTENAVNAAFAQNLNTRNQLLQRSRNQRFGAIGLQNQQQNTLATLFGGRVDSGAVIGQRLGQIGSLAGSSDPAQIADNIRRLTNARFRNSRDTSINETTRVSRDAGFANALQANTQALQTLTSETIGLAQIQQDLARLESIRQAAGGQFDQLLGADFGQIQQIARQQQAFAILAGVGVDAGGDRQAQEAVRRNSLTAVENLRARGLTVQDALAGFAFNRDRFQAQDPQGTSQLEARLRLVAGLGSGLSVDQARDIQGRTGIFTGRGQSAQEQQLAGRAQQEQQRQLEAVKQQQALLQEQINQFNAQTLQQLNAGFEGLQEAARVLSQVDGKIFEIQQTVIVDFRGADVLQRLTPEIERIAIEQAKLALADEKNG